LWGKTHSYCLNSDWLGLAPSEWSWLASG
jgi:hypothetical protein